MTMATTALHIWGQQPDAVERALEAIFAREGRARVLRLQGAYSAVLARVLADDAQAGYRYVIVRPHAGAAWTPLLELGNRADGLDRVLSQALGGAAVFSTFVYSDAVAGYRMTRDGAEVDRYLSDPDYFASLATEDGEAQPLPESPGAVTDRAQADGEAVRGRPERFADLLPPGTSPEDFARVVLHPGWWEERAVEPATPAESAPPDAASEDEDEDLVDEADRMRCIGLALELWGPSEYPFAGELEEIPNQVAGPVVALAFA